MTIQSYFNDFSSNQLEKFDLAVRLYTEWNEKINLISRKDIHSLMTRHILHSLGIAKVIEFLPKSQIIDVGTGGGFPGIPLAICFPEVQFCLVDSIDKKIQAVKDISKTLKLDNVLPIRARVEEINHQFDFVISRAVTSMPRFVKWVTPLINHENKHQIENGILYLKGGDLSTEMKDFKYYETFNLSDYFNDPFFKTKKVLYLPRQYFPRN